MQNLGIKKLFAASILSLAITGCASDGAISEDTAILDESQTQEVAESPDLDVSSEEQAGMANSLLEQKIIYFGYDRSEILPEFKDVLNAHAEYLVANPQASIVFEGHCDERGTIEYNLALGERRANTVKSYLIVKGVSSSQLESVSFGEERPALFGSDENTWSKNRRAEIRYSQAAQLGDNQ